jgi:NitT/TauT family transport system permease protein
MIADRLEKVKPSSENSDELANKKYKEHVFREKVNVSLGRLIVGIIIFGLWELLSGKLINEFWFSKPSDIIKKLYELLITGDLWFHVSFTLQEALIGLSIGMVVGTIFGIAFALSGKLDQWLSPYIMAIYSLPRVALAPLFVVWFGIGMTSKVIMVVAMVVFVAFYNAYEGIKNMDHDLLDMMKTLKAGKMKVLTWVILPSITVWILNSLRLNIGMALIGAVIAELVGSNRGLGYYITYSSSLLDITGVFAGLTIIMIIAVLLEQIIKQFEKRLLKHR